MSRCALGWACQGPSLRGERRRGRGAMGVWGGAWGIRAAGGWLTWTSHPRSAVTGPHSVGKVDTGATQVPWSKAPPWVEEHRHLVMRPLVQGCLVAPQRRSSLPFRSASPASQHSAGSEIFTQTERRLPPLFTCTQPVWAHTAPLSLPLGPASAGAPRAQGTGQETIARCPKLNI